MICVSVINSPFRLEGKWLFLHKVAYAVTLYELKKLHKGKNILISSLRLNFLTVYNYVRMKNEKKNYVNSAPEFTNNRYKTLRVHDAQCTRMCLSENYYPHTTRKDFTLDSKS